MMQIMRQILATVVGPALQSLPDKMSSPAARAMMLAIGMQESRLKHRRQIAGYRKDGTVIDGPARGLWQFERDGGVKGVLRHPATRTLAQSVCWHLGNSGTTAAVYHQLEHDDILACCFARLLLWTLPAALPDRNDPDNAWGQYIAAWRPGDPHRETWNEFYTLAWGAAE